MNCARAGIWLAVALCVLAVPVKADQETDPLARIEALTAEQVSDVMFQLLRDRVESCRIEFVSRDMVPFKLEVLGTLSKQLDLPEQRHSELSRALARKIDSFDGPDQDFLERLNATYQFPAGDEDRTVLLVRNCQVLGS